MVALTKFSFRQGDGALGLHSMAFRHFPEVSEFSKILSSVIRQLVRQLVCTLFISNNRTLFLLW